MIFFDYEGIFASEARIENKYALTSVIAQRARQISEQKGQGLLDGAEKAISLATRELLEGKLHFRLSDGEK